MAESDRRGDAPPPRQGGTHAVLAQPDDDGAAAYCRNRLAASGRPASAPIVVLADAESDHPRTPAGRDRQGVVIAVGERLRSTAAAAAEPELGPATVSAPSDLPAVAGSVEDYLAAWAGAGYRPVVCVDSLSGLLANGTIREAYRFLYVLSRRLDRLDGDLHLHVDPRAHEEEIIRTFLAVADRTVSFGDGGPLP